MSTKTQSERKFAAGTCRMNGDDTLCPAYTAGYDGAAGFVGNDAPSWSSDYVQRYDKRLGANVDEPGTDPKVVPEGKAKEAWLAVLDSVTGPQEEFGRFVAEKLGWLEDDD